MRLIYTIGILVLIQLVVYSHSQKFFRRDYTYLETTYSFYKIHTALRTWDDAKTRCEIEGATLFYPEDATESQEVRNFWDKTQNTIGLVFVGMRAFYAKQAFMTLDRRSVHDVYSNWAPGEPNMFLDDEECVVLSSKGTFYDAQCHSRRSFICKKRLEDLQWNENCDLPDPDYVYSNSTGHCYKFHIDQRNWTEAFDVCHSEQSLLAIIDDDDEANYLSKFALDDHGRNGRSFNHPNVVFLGFRREFGGVWNTIRGVRLEKGYSRWGDREPNGGDREVCGAMFANSGRLNDHRCGDRLFFICEREVAARQTTLEEESSS